MVAEDPGRQHLSFSVDGIDMLYRGTDLLYTGAIYGMQDCFMYAWKDYIVVPTQFLRQDCFYPGIEKGHSPMDSGSSGEKISSLSFPVVPGADPGLTPFLFRMPSS